MPAARLVSRRWLVRGGLAVAATAGLGATLTGHASAPPGTLLSEGVLDGAPYGLDRPRWRLALPEGTRPRGLVVALHGLGGDADGAFDLGYADAVAATGLALVSVDGHDGYWHARRDGTDSGALVREALLPLALPRAGLPATSRVGLLGWSMGGYGALLLAGDLGPARVSGVVAASAALWRTAGESPARAFDDRADHDAHTVLGREHRLAGIPVRLDCGRSDPFAAANRVLAARLPGAETHFDAGGHEDAWWREHSASEMAWLAARA